MRVVERVAGHYETQDVEFGKVYKWCPDCVVVECECGQRLIKRRSEILESVTFCECGTDHTSGIREETVLQVLEEGEDLHPWRSWKSSAETGIPF